MLILISLSYDTPYLVNLLISDNLKNNYHQTDPLSLWKNYPYMWLSIVDLHIIDLFHVCSDDLYWLLSHILYTIVIHFKSLFIHIQPQCIECSIDVKPIPRTRHLNESVREFRLPVLQFLSVRVRKAWICSPEAENVLRNLLSSFFEVKKWNSIQRAFLGWRYFVSNYRGFRNSFVLFD